MKEGKNGVANMATSEAVEAVTVQALLPFRAMAVSVWETQLLAMPKDSDNDEFKALGKLRKEINSDRQRMFVFPVNDGMRTSSISVHWAYLCWIPSKTLFLVNTFDGAKTLARIEAVVSLVLQGLERHIIPFLDLPAGFQALSPMTKLPVVAKQPNNHCCAYQGAAAVASILAEMKQNNPFPVLAALQKGTFCPQVDEKALRLQTLLKLAGGVEIFPLPKPAVGGFSLSSPRPTMSGASKASVVIHNEDSDDSDGCDDSKEEAKKSQNKALGQFMTRMFNGQKISQRPSDGYIDGTAMAQANGVQLKIFNKTKQCKEFINALTIRLNNNYKVYFFVMFKIYPRFQKNRTQVPKQNPYKFLIGVNFCTFCISIRN